MFKRMFLCLVILSTILFTGCFIEGKVVDENGVGVSGVTVTLNSKQTRSTLTNSDGIYRFGDLSNLDVIPAGNYTVTPSISGYSFVPAGASVTITGQTLGDLGDIPGPDIAVNFTASAYVDPFWEVDAPEAHGFDPVKLQEAADWVEHCGDSKKSDSLIVIQDGYIVLERYWNGMDQYTPKQVWSVTKSFAGTLVGIAQYQGFLDINEPVANYIPEWTGTESESVTIRNLLSGDSGRFWDFEGDFFFLFGVQPDDVTQYAIERGQLYEPGITWQYNQMGMQCLDRVLSVATGQSTVSFAQEYLFDPLGMAHTSAELDPAGQMMLPWGISSTARDMARLGYLWLNGGMWNGERILSPEYIEEATSPNEVNPAYGYMWWLNPDGGWIQSVTLEPQEGKYLPDAPPDVFTASGNGGQMIMVSPSENMVIVRQGNDPPGHSSLTYSRIYREIAAARNQH